MKDKAIEALINTLSDGAKNIPKITETMIRQYQQSQLFYGIASFAIAIFLIILIRWVWMKLFEQYKQYKQAEEKKQNLFSTRINFSSFVYTNDLEIQIVILSIGTLIVGVIAISLLVGGCDNIGNYISPINGLINNLTNK
jgi:hypothetical protein